MASFHRGKVCRARRTRCRVEWSVFCIYRPAGESSCVPGWAGLLAPDMSGALAVAWLCAEDVVLLIVVSDLNAVGAAHIYRVLPRPRARFIHQVHKGLRRR